MTRISDFAFCLLPSAFFILAIFLTGCSPPTVAALPAVPAAAEAPRTAETAPSSRPPAKKVARPVEAIDRVLIISIDGLRPDLALRAYMPRLRALCASGSYTFWADTAAEAYTLPCHVSMLTGVSSDKHGVIWNEYMEEAYPNSPTLFELAHEVGYTTALVTGKMKFITLLTPASVGNALRGVPRVAEGDTKGSDFRAQELDETANSDSPSPEPPAPSPNREPQPPTPVSQPLLFQRSSFRAANTLDNYYLPDTEPISDHEVATEAVRILRDHRPEVFFIHFPGVDTIGHEHGWGTAEQLTAIEEADAAHGRILDVLAELDLTNSTLVILTADHGGAGLDHRAGDPRAHFIPWIISGPGIRKDYDLTLADRPIRIEDTFATACAFLGIVSGAPSEGKPVMDILQGPEPASVENALRGVPVRGAEFIAN